jgi:hypothetical protein
MGAALTTDGQQQQPQTLRKADHAKAARYQCDHHRVVSQGDHLLHQNQSAPRCTGGERYEAHERDQVSKPGGPHGQSSSSYWRATWHSVEGSLSRGTKKRAKQRRISIFGESSISSLRDDITKTLDRKANELRSQLSMLGHAPTNKMGQRGPLKGRKVPPKYRSPSGETWAGREARGHSAPHVDRSNRVQLVEEGGCRVTSNNEIKGFLQHSGKRCPCRTMAVVRSPNFLRALNQRDCACRHPAREPQAGSSQRSRRHGAVFERLISVGDLHRGGRQCEGAPHSRRRGAARCNRCEGAGSAGFNNVDLASAEKLKMTVMRVPAYSPRPLPRAWVALMLALNRNIHHAYNRVREGNFDLSGLVGFNLAGKTVGIVGTGKIGTALAHIMKGFGCRLVGYDTYNNPACLALDMKYVDLSCLLAESDIVSLHCPLTPETAHLINCKTIALMKRGSMLINTARGALIDTRAAIDAPKMREWRDLPPG